MQNKVNQIAFNSIFFDTLFGLIIFFNIDNFLAITNPVHFIFYLFGVIIAAHWWLIFKSADDSFGPEVTDSVMDLVFGLGYFICIAFFVYHAQNFDIKSATIPMIALFGIDIVWSLIWKYCGKWSRSDNPQQIRGMERELNGTILTSTVGLILFLINAILAYFLNGTLFTFTFGLSYFVYIFLTFKYKIIDIRIF